MSNGDSHCTLAARINDHPVQRIPKKLIETLAALSCSSWSNEDLEGSQASLRGTKRPRGVQISAWLGRSRSRTQG